MSAREPIDVIVTGAIAVERRTRLDGLIRESTVGLLTC